MDDAEIVIVGFGTAGRISLSAVRAARAAGIRVGLLRPVTLSPFPTAQVREAASRARALLVVEMNTGQMLDDVKLAVEFYGRLGGVTPFPDEILAEIQRLAKGSFSAGDDPRNAWLQRLRAAVN